MSALSRTFYLDLDLTSAQGQALKQSVAQKFGPGIVEAAKLARRMFLLRSPWAPGMRFVGAETTAEVLGEAGAAPAPFSLSGSGEEIEEAFVSCVGEGIDRLAQIECEGDVIVEASLKEVAARVLPAAITEVQQAMLTAALPSGTVIAWVQGNTPDITGSIADSDSVLLPADWCLRRCPDKVRLMPRTALSVGVAAGPSFEWAAVRAVLELIERDAASLWWQGGRRGTAIPLDHPSMAEITRFVAALRQQTTHRRFWMLDITSDIGIPVVAALSCDDEGLKLACGLASRLSLAEAMRAAILELCQTELALQLAQIRQQETGEENVLPIDRAHLRRGVAIDANRCELLHPAGVQLAHFNKLPTSNLSAVVQALDRAGIELAFVNLTRPQFNVLVVRAIAPALQPMPSTIVTDRLRRAFEEFGGGDRHTGGLALIE